MSEENYKDDDTMETVDSVDSILDSLTDDQYVQYLTDGSLPAGITLPSSSENTESEGEEPSSEEDSYEDNNIESKEEDSEEQEEAESNPEESQESEEPTEEDDSFKKLFSKPIKANGTEFVLENLDEAISLIQKGAGFEAKMKKLKPSMKIIKSLEENSISESDVNILIDVFKGNKAAIKNLLVKHNIDTLELEESKEYTPSKNIVSDKVINLADNIDAIKNSQYSDNIMNVISNVWDEESKNLIASRPETLLELLEEFNLGRFDTIQAIVARENVLGKNTVPDIVRYGQLAKMYEDGELKLNTPVKKKEAEVIETKKQAKPSPSSGKAPKPAPKKTPSDYSDTELERMSDEEYKKLFG